MRRKVAVTGIGAGTPLGVAARTLYEPWRGGHSRPQDGQGVATDFEPNEHLSVIEVHRANHFTQSVVVARARPSPRRSRPRGAATLPIVPVSSTKSVGSVAAVKAAEPTWAFHDRIASSTLGWEAREERMDLNYAPQQASPLPVKGTSAGGVGNAFGVGAQNIVLPPET